MSERPGPRTQNPTRIPLGAFQQLRGFRLGKKRCKESIDRLFVDCLNILSRILVTPSTQSPAAVLISCLQVRLKNRFYIKPVRHRNVVCVNVTTNPFNKFLRKQMNENDNRVAIGTLCVCLHGINNYSFACIQRTEA